MINTVRIRAADFIGTEYEDIVWNKIAEAKKKCPFEFKVNFYVEDSKQMMDVSKAVSAHADALQLKTTIKLWEKCKDEYVFLDVCTKVSENRVYRFLIVDQSPINVIRAMSFLVDHSDIVRRSYTDNDKDSKRQKRNDSSDYDYNKK